MGFVVIGNTNREIRMDGIRIPSGTDVIFGNSDNGMWEDKKDAEFYLDKLTSVNGFENLTVRVEKEAEIIDSMIYAKDVENGDVEEDVSCYGNEVDILAGENWVGDLWICTQF